MSKTPKKTAKPTAWEIRKDKVNAARRAKRKKERREAREAAMAFDPGAIQDPAAAKNEPMNNPSTEAKLEAPNMNASWRDGYREGQIETRRIENEKRVSHFLAMADFNEGRNVITILEPSTVESIRAALLEAGWFRKE